jgi:Starch-binding associating with outer membrane
MKKINYRLAVFFLLGIMSLASCKKYLDINTDPDNIVSTNAPLPQLLTSAQVNVAFEGGSDLYRYSNIISQKVSGQASQPNQTYEYDKYNITGSDLNNVWSSLNATSLSDLELIIKTATAGGSPYYSGIAKTLKAYEYQLMVDAWGDIPFSEAQQLDKNVTPKYDKGEDIYKALIVLLTEAVTELNAATSNLVPGSTSVIYPGNFSTVKANWIKFANTLKLRILLHYSKKDPAFMLAQMNALIASTGVTFMASPADNFQMAFVALPSATNPIHQFENSRRDYLFAANQLVTLMNTKVDPRRASYFTPLPYFSSPATYKGVTAGDPATINYSRIHTYLRGAATGTPPPTTGGIASTALTYTGAAPIRMLTYAEYCFIRAEAALSGVTGSAQTFFTQGITANMQDAGVSAADIATYLAASGTLTGTPAQQLQQIIEEKFVALYGVTMESWTDYRRTGYPALTPPSNAVTPTVPRSLFYPQSEIDLNPKNPGQKASMQVKVFWDL